ncbi:MAG: ABC transporter permease [Terriglobales bacterium]|jgi:ABC-2 type transport system permease protein
MNTQSNAIPESSLESHVIAATSLSAPRLFYWSVRRELWENRSVYIAPLAVAGVILFGFSFSTIAGTWEKALRLDPTHHEAIAMPYDFAAALLMGTAILVSVFYCLDALHGERRDRGILFWKSLPVSDLMTVLAKASIPLIVLPLLTFAITVATQLIMLLVSTAVLAASGLHAWTLWTQLPFLQMSLLLLYHLVTAHALWPAPIYCWLLLVSGWARRAPFLWASLPLLAIFGVEKIAFHTSHFASIVGSHIIGAAPAIARTGPDMFPMDPMAHITPAEFLSSPGLWIGLVVAAIFLAAAVRLRRYQGPI